MKTSVIARLREADGWLCRHGGVPFQWLRDLLRDAAQELESESGALWLQWTTGPGSHVRIFVAGDMGLDELDSLIEVLVMSRGHRAKRLTSAESTVEPSTEEP